jgi:hypothetical protein
MDRENIANGLPTIASAPHITHGRSVLRTFGVTEEFYAEELRRQSDACAICGGPAAGRGAKYGRFCIDHDHKTGRYRGLLCSKCNTGLGQMGDDPERLERAAAYLRRQPP